MYKRILLKLSGESLKGDGKYGIDPKTVKKVAVTISQIYHLNVDIAIVVGAGNIFRGQTGEELGMDRSQADYMGMLGTIMNGLALQDSLEQINIPTRVLSAISSNTVAEPYIRRRALRHLEKRRVLILVGGTGSPYFSTDTAAALRAAELNVDIVLMAKNGVNGVYNKDPKIHNNAVLYDRITQKEVIENKLQVMDLTAASMCRDNKINIIVFDVNVEDNIKNVVLGKKIGTNVVWEDK